MTIYRGVSGVNRQIKEQYRCVYGVNRKVKEQYRSVAGVNRKIFSSEILLYNAGDECTAVTGGWDAQTVYEVSSGDYITYTENATNITISGTGKTNVSCFKGGITQSAVNLTGFAALTCQLDVSNVGPGAIANQAASIFICSAKGSIIAAAYAQTNTAGSQTLTVDVSSLNGNYYIWALIHLGGSSSYKITSVITQIKLTI